MKKKPEKEKDLEQLRVNLANTGNVFLTGYEKMTVGQDFELRKAIRGAGGDYKVIKNTIAEKAAQGTPSEALLKDLKGMCSIAYTSGDPVALAKALTTYAKENPAFVFKAGMVEGRVIDVTEKTYTIELTGNGSKLDAFLDAIDRTAILETVRTGGSGIGRGERILKV